MKTRLNDRLVRSLKPPSGLTASGKPKKDELFTDTELRGFMCRVTRNGSKSFLVQRKDLSGKTRRVRIGDWPALTAEQARREAQRVLAEMETGGVEAIAQKKNRRTEKGSSETSDRIGDLIQRYEKLHLSNYREHSRSIALSGLKDVLSGHMDKRLADLTTADVVLATDRWRARGQNVTANRRTGQVRTFINWCRSRGVEVQPIVFQKTREKSRDRVLSADELAIVLKCLDKMEHLDFPDAARLFILTGARRTEISELHSSEVDLKNHVIRLSADRTKGGQAVTIPLSPAAQEIVERRLRFVPDGFLFGRWSQGRKPFSGFSKLKRELDTLLNEALPGMEPWVIHDLRRSAATLMVEKCQADPLLVDSEILHHVTSLPSIARVYIRSQRLDQARKALDDWGQYVTGLATENVVQIDTARA